MSETYSKSVDFGGQIDAAQLHTAIENEASIMTTLLRVDVYGDVITIVFVSTLNPAEKTILDTVVSNHVPAPESQIISEPGAITIMSALDDPAAIEIIASDPLGGVSISAGGGGIALDTTDTVAVTAGQTSTFTTTTGDIEIRAELDEVHVDGAAGIYIGSLLETAPIYIGTPLAARTITIGNATGNSSIQCLTGSGGFALTTAAGGGIAFDANAASSHVILNSNADGQDLLLSLTGNHDSSIIIDGAGTGPDAIKINASAGGTQWSSVGLMSMNSTSNGIQLDATGASSHFILAATAAAQDLTLAVTGAQDASLILDSAGTGADAIKVNASAGGAQLTAAGTVSLNSTNAIQLDAAGASSHFALAATGDAQDLTLAVTGSHDASLILNSAGTGADAIKVNASAGGAQWTSAGVMSLSASNALQLDATGASSHFILAATNDAQDLTIALTGAHDASIILDSAGTGSDAIQLTSVGGTAINATGQLQLMSAQASTTAIQLDTTAGNGGIALAAGSSGFSLTVASSGPCSIGNDTGTGDIQLGTGAVARNVLIGNTTSSSSLALRWGSGGLMRYQPAETTLSDADTTLTVAQLLTGIIVMTPTVNRNITLPDASNVVSTLASVQVNDAITFTIINEGLGIVNPTLSVLLGSGASSVGYLDIPPSIGNLASFFTSGCAMFRLRLTNVTLSTEAYTLYRVA